MWTIIVTCASCIVQGSIAPVGLSVDPSLLMAHGCLRHVALKAGDVKHPRSATSPDFFLPSQNLCV